MRLQLSLTGAPYLNSTKPRLTELNTTKNYMLNLLIISSTRNLPNNSPTTKCKCLCTKWTTHTTTSIILSIKPALRSTKLAMVRLLICKLTLKLTIRDTWRKWPRPKTCTTAICRTQLMFSTESWRSGHASSQPEPKLLRSTWTKLIFKKGLVLLFKPNSASRRTNLNKVRSNLRSWINMPTATPPDYKLTLLATWTTCKWIRCSITIKARWHSFVITSAFD